MLTDCKLAFKGYWSAPISVGWGCKVWDAPDA